MKVSTLISCLSARTTRKNIGRLASGLLLLLAFTLPLPAVDLLYVGLAGSIVTFDVSSGNATTIASTKTTFVPSITPYGMAFDSSGNLFVAEGTSNTIYEITPGGTKTTFATVPGFPFGMAIDSSDNLYTANFTGNSLSKITPGGTVSAFGSSMTRPAGLAFDSSGNLYAALNSGTTINKITSGGTVSTFASGLTSPYALAFDSSGNLYASSNTANTISKITTGGSVSTFKSGLSSPAGLAFDQNDNLYVANNSTNTITKMDSSGATLFSFSVGAAQLPRFIAYVPGTPVPEPSTYALAAIATGVMGVMALRRKARQSA